MIYVLSDGVWSDFKIGFTADERSLKGRKLALEAGRTEPLRLVFTVEGTLSHEHAIHRLLATHRIRREWYARCDAVVAAIYVLRHYGPDFLLQHTIEQLAAYQPFGDDVVPSWAALQHRMHHGRHVRSPWWHQHWQPRR